jgi:hypothetical protein
MMLNGELGRNISPLSTATTGPWLFTHLIPSGPAAGDVGALESEAPARRGS